MEEIQEYQEKVFENIKHIDENGNEYWEARELQQVLGYKEWRYFSMVVEKAQIACSKSNNNINSNFGVNTKIVKTGVSTKTVIDYKLSRYACYLIVQNSNPKYKTVALGQTYFAIQTRKIEQFEEQFSKMSDDEKKYIEENKLEMVIELYTKWLVKKVLKILINLPMQDIKGYIMGKQQMILLNVKV